MGKVSAYSFGKLTKTVAATAQPLSAEPIFTPAFEVYVPSGNSADVYIGGSNVTTGWIPRAKGATKEFSCETAPGEPKYFDLSRIYYIGTAGDSVIIQYRKHVN